MFQVALHPFAGAEVGVGRQAIAKVAVVETGDEVPPSLSRSIRAC